MRRQFTGGSLAIDPTGYITSPQQLARDGILYVPESIPIYGERLSYFIAGPPGCGKSTTAADILSLFPKMPIFLFTDLEEEDRAFKGIPMRKMKMDADLLDELKPEMLTSEGDCWVVFDDIDKIRDPKVSKKVIALMDNIIANGRRHNKHTIHVIATSHSLADYKKTKYMIENCSYWVIFPNKTINSQLKRLLSKLDLEKLNLKPFSRVFVHQIVPSFIVTDDFISTI